MPAMKASKSAIVGSSSDAGSGGRRPAPAARIIGTAKMPRPTTSQRFPSRFQARLETGVKERRVKDGEVFDADSCGELVVNNAVEHRSDNANSSDFKGFHRGATLDDSVTVETSPYHSKRLPRRSQ
jgi:hypothetical protein